MANTRYFFRFVDWDNEVATTSVWVQNIVDAGTNYTSVITDGNELRTALEYFSLAPIRALGFTKTFSGSGAAVTDPHTQRETKFLVVMQDTTAELGAGIFNPGHLKYFTFEIPAADLDLLAAGSDLVDLSDAAHAAHIAALQANARSPWNNNAGAGVTPTQIVVRIQHVGRNN